MVRTDAPGLLPQKSGAGCFLRGQKELPMNSVPVRLHLSQKVHMEKLTADMRMIFPLRAAAVIPGTLTIPMILMTPGILSEHMIPMAQAVLMAHPVQTEAEERGLAEECAPALSSKEFSSCC